MKKNYRQKFFEKIIAVGSVVAPDFTAEQVVKIFTKTHRYERPTRELEDLVHARRLRFQNGLVGYEWGHSNAPTVLLVHGWNGRGSQMSFLAKGLADAGFRAVAMDGPAHGESDGHFTDAGHFSDGIAEVGRELGVIEAVIGHSFGGGTAVWAIKKGIDAKKLVMIASPSSYARVMTRFSHSLKLSTRVNRDFIEKMKERAGLDDRYLDVGVMGRELDIPTLAIHDAGDRDVPYHELQLLQTAWPAIEVVTTTGHGHRRILRSADVLQNIERFLKS